MKMLNLGFIGAGRMATALAKGCVEARVTPGASITASDPSEPAREAFATANQLAPSSVRALYRWMSYSLPAASAVFIEGMLKIRGGKSS